MRTTSVSRASYLDFAANNAEERPIALVVHGSPTMRRALLVTLDLDGFDARAVGDAREALLFLEEYRPHVVITELNLKCEDVAYLFSQLQSRSATRHIPLILFSRLAATPPSPEWSVGNVHHVPLEHGVGRLLDVLHENVAES